MSDKALGLLAAVSLTLFFATGMFLIGAWPVWCLTFLTPHCYVVWKIFWAQSNETSPVTRM